MQWFVVYTKSRAEKKVSEILTRKKIENYLPLNRVNKKYKIKSKISDEPLFKSYVFVFINERRLAEVKKVSGILNLVYWLGKPVVINDSEIELIKRFLSDHLNVTAEKIRLGENKLRKIEDSFTEEEKRKVIHKKVRIVLESLGYIITAETEASKVRIISPNSLIHQTRSGPLKLFNPVHTFYNFFKN